MMDDYLEEIEAVWNSVFRGKVIWRGQATINWKQGRGPEMSWNFQAVLEKSACLGQSMHAAIAMIRLKTACRIRV